MADSDDNSKDSGSQQDASQIIAQSKQLRKVPNPWFPGHEEHHTGDIAKYAMNYEYGSGYIKVTLATISGTYPLVPRSVSHQIPDGAEKGLIGDLISVQVQNDMQNDIPTVTMTLGNTMDWSSVIAVNDLIRVDYVLPYFNSNYTNIKQVDRCLYTGLVSNASRNNNINGSQQTYTIVGQGMAKIMSNIQLSTFSDLQSNLTGYQLLPDDEKTGIGFKQHTSANIIKRIINRFVLQNQGGVNTYDFLGVQQGEDITARTTAVQNGFVHDLMGQPMSPDQYDAYLQSVADQNDDESDPDGDGNANVDQDNPETANQGESWLNIPLMISAGGELPIQNLIEFYIYENLDESYPDAGPNNPFVNYNGSILQFIKDVSAKPFNEMYWTHDRGIATFNYRPTPFDPENWKGLPITELSPRDILDINISTTDQEQAAVFKITPTQGLGLTQYEGGWNGDLAPLTNLDLVHRYGYKLLQAQVDYFNGNQSEGIQSQVTAGTSDADSEALKGYTDEEASLHYPPYTSIADVFYYTSGRKGNSNVSIPKEAGGNSAYNQVASYLRTASNAHDFQNDVASLGITQSQANTLWTMRNGFNKQRYISVMMPNYVPTTTNISKNSSYLKSYNMMKKHPKKAASEVISELGFAIGSKQAYDLVQAALANGGEPSEADYQRILAQDKFTDTEDGVDGSPISGQDSVPFLFLRYSEKLFDWYADNAKFYSGTVTLSNFPDPFRPYIGERIEFFDDSINGWWEFYCEGINVNWSYQSGLQVTMNITRGVPMNGENDYGRRFNQNGEDWGFWGKYSRFVGGYFGEQNLATAIANSSKDDSGGGASGGDWGWPFDSIKSKDDALSGTSPEQRFGSGSGWIRPGGSTDYHDGFDFGSAKYGGQPIKAIHGGKVQTTSGLGMNAIWVVADDYATVYQEFGPGADVKVGDTIKTGDTVGHFAGGSHVHIGISSEKDMNKAESTWNNPHNSNWKDPIETIANATGKDK